MPKSPKWLTYSKIVMSIVFLIWGSAIYAVYIAQFTELFSAIAPIISRFT